MVLDTSKKLKCMHCSHQRWCHFQSLKRKKQPVDTDCFESREKIFIFRKKTVSVDKALEKEFLN